MRILKVLQLLLYKALQLYKLGEENVWLITEEEKNILKFRIRSKIRFYHTLFLKDLCNDNTLKDLIKL